MLSPAVPRPASRATTTSWEGEPLARLWRACGQLMAFEHHGLLAADGHAARQESARGALGIGQGALEDLVSVADRPSGGTVRPRHRPHRLQGRLAGAVAAPSRRQGARVRARPADQAQPVRGRSHREPCSPRTRAPTSRISRSSRSTLARAAPEVVFHLAAQPLVREAIATRSALRQQRHGHGARAGGGARACDRSAPSWSSPPTRSTRTASGPTPIARSTRSAGTTPTAPARRRPRSWRPATATVSSAAGPATRPAWRPPAPAT